MDVPGLYDKLYVNSVRSQLYNYCNIILVINHIRKACIVSIRPELLESVRDILKPYNIIIKEYIKPGVYILSWISGAYDRIIEKIRKLSRKNKNFNVTTGQILGYLTPINIKSSNEPGKRCFLSVDILVPKSTNNAPTDNIYNIALMPQRVLNINDDDIMEYYTPAYNFFRGNMNSFSEFIITDVQIVITKHTMSGGRRKTRKSRVLY